ncbi:MAG TPA: PIG-L family deacetylase [Phycisphaerales bacterium]|nr:PIG-L family deacetylase [Phycisphaerales bacterium]
MNILVVGPHPDDQELGMGGTVALLADQGHDVLLLDVTDGCPTPRGDRPTRLKEAAEAAAVLRVRRQLLDLPNRRVEHTIENRYKVAGVIRAHQAQVVFLPHPEDAHPDHLAVTRIVEDARFDAKLTKLELPGDQGRPPIYPKWLIYYYCSHLRRVPDPTLVMDISATEERKMASIMAYRSQFADNPLNMQVPEWIAAGNRYFGSRIGTRAGEPFYTKEPLGLGSLGGLVF